MIVDSTDRPWIAAALAATAAGAAFYIPYALRAPSGPSGGSWPGIVYGIAGAAMMAAAGLLGARRKLPNLRAGRVQTWMRAHVWLGLLSVPMILFHSGFALGGALTAALTLLFAIIVLSGIFGLVLQQFIPKLLMEQVPAEVIYDQADQFLEELRETAEQRVASVKPKAATPEDEAAYEVVHQFYTAELQPFLMDRKYKGLLSTEQRTKAVFDHIRKLVPPASHPVVDELRRIAQRRRDLTKQIRLHQLLHGWLLVHVPLSAAVLVLAAVHAVMALRYI